MHMLPPALRTLANGAFWLALSSASSALTVSYQRSAIGAGGYITLDSAVVGLAFSNGSDNPFVPAARSDIAPAGAVGSLNVVEARITGSNLAPVSTTNTSYGRRVTVTERYTTVVQPTVGDIRFGDKGAFASISFDGSFTLVSPTIPGVAGGGAMTFSDLKLDLRRGMITADVSSNPGSGFDSGGDDLDIFSIGQLRGVTGLNYQGTASALAEQGWSVQPSIGTSAVNTWELTGWLEASQLKATQAFQNEFIYALDVSEGGTAYNVLGALNGTNTGWGTLRLGMGMRLYDAGWPAPLPLVVVDATQMLRPVSSVPEPSAIGLMLLGVCALGWKARTRAARADASSVRTA